MSTMYLSIPDAAALIGIPLRTFRTQLKRDEVPVWSPTERGSRVLLKHVVKYLPPELAAKIPADTDWTDVAAVRKVAKALGV